MTKLLGLALAMAIGCVTAARTAPCVDLALVLAVDGSGSISDSEFEFQKSAIATAIRADEVRHALQGAGIVMLSAVFWGDGEFSSQQLSWHMVVGGRNIEAFALEIETTPRHVFGNTDIGSGLWTALDMIENVGVCADRMIINISGDGKETIAPKRRQTASLSVARERATRMGVTVNALTVSDEVPDLADYYARSVITGAGSFVMDVRELGDFTTAIRRKLTREITSGMVADIRHHVEIVSATR